MINYWTPSLVTWANLPKRSPLVVRQRRPIRSLVLPHFIDAAVDVAADHAAIAGYAAVHPGHAIAAGREPVVALHPVLMGVVGHDPTREPGLIPALAVPIAHAVPRVPTPGHAVQLAIATGAIPAPVAEAV